MKIAINGFGRIGRQLFKQFYEKDHNIVLINDPCLSLEQSRILLSYDSVYGKFPYRIESQGNDKLKIGTENITQYYSTKNIEDLNLEGVDIFIDSSGKEKNYEQYKKLMERYPNLKKVVITTYSQAADQTIIDGVNHERLRKDSKIISTCTCDSVAILPILQNCMKRNIESVSIITLHPFLSNQRLLDGCDMKVEDISLITQWRAAPDALIPKKTSIQTIALDMFEGLKGKLNAYQIRVPTSCVSCAFIDIHFKEPINKEWSNDLLKKLEKYYLVNTDHLTSKDFMGDRHSGIIDMRRFIVEEKSIKLLVWYDNESGYCSKVLDIINLANKGE